MISLPIELLQEIVNHIPDRSSDDLLALSLASHALRACSEARLYRDINLCGEHDGFYDSDSERLEFWSSTINGSPRLASLVHSLTIPEMAFAQPLTERAETLDFFQALRSVTNLKELCIKPSGPRTAHSVQNFKLLLGLPFRLRALSIYEYTFAEGEDMRIWFGEQCDIQFLGVVPSIMSPYYLLSSIHGSLPHLSSVELGLVTDRELNLLSGRPIERLSMTYNTGWDVRLYHPHNQPENINIAVSAFRNTLTHLKWDITTSTTRTIYIVENIARELHLLKFFSLNLHDRSYEEDRLLDAFSHFKQLDTLVLNMHLTAFEGGNSYEKADEYHPSLRSRLRLFPLTKKCREVAEKLMSSCTSLSRVALYFKLRGSVEHRPCYSRNSDRSIQLEGFDMFDDKYWRQV